MEKLEFKPTLRWIRDHQYKPDGCPDKECYCIIDHINKHDYGFCVGIRLNNINNLDIISFCNNTYSRELPDEQRRYLWHPNEALWISTCLSVAVVNAWSFLPIFRKQLGYLNRQRTRELHKRQSHSTEGE